MYIVEPNRVCCLASLSYVIIKPMYPQEINRAVMYVPSCYVLPEDLISGLAMQGKLVTLSQGATFSNVPNEGSML